MSVFSSNVPERVIAGFKRIAGSIEPGEIVNPAVHLGTFPKAPPERLGGFQVMSSWICAQQLGSASGYSQAGAVVPLGIYSSTPDEGEAARDIALGIRRDTIGC